MKIGDILEQFIKSYPSFKEFNRPKLIKIKDEMFAIYQSEQVGKKWVDLLIEPISEIERISNLAFEKISTDLKNETGDVFLYCHACFYHLQTLEFLTLPSLKHLHSFKPSKIITFIDDIYDIHVRLRQPKEMLFGSKDVVDAMIFDLLKILDWRINEISVSRYLSSQLEIPNEFYVLSIKHSKKTLYDLIFENKQTLYLSHPISQPRRFQEEGKEKEAEQIIAEIKEISDYFSNQFVCFLPTTIDELRLKDKKNDQGEKEFIYGLKDRWEKQSYEKTNTSILYEIPENKGNPRKRIPFGEPSECITDVPYLLKVLFKIIDRQVTIRDKKLVEQSMILFIYRPGFAANLSKGVRYELDYYQLLNKTQHDKINCFIYYPASDQKELKIKIALEEINQIIINKGMTLDGEDKNRLISVWENNEDIAEMIEETLSKYEKEAKIPEGTLAKDPFGERRIFFLELVSRIKINFEKTLHLYKGNCDLFIEDDNLKPHDILSKIEPYLKPILK